MKDRNNQMYMPYDNGFFYPYMSNDIENRLDALERMVKRLDTRVSRLENNSMYQNNNQNMPDVYNQNIYPNAYPNTMHMM